MPKKPFKHPGRAKVGDDVDISSFDEPIVPDFGQLDEVPRIEMVADVSLALNNYVSSVYTARGWAIRVELPDGETYIMRFEAL